MEQELSPIHLQEIKDRSAFSVPNYGYEIKVLPDETPGSDAVYVAIMYKVPKVAEQLYIEHLRNNREDVVRLLDHSEMQKRRINVYTGLLREIRQLFYRARQDLDEGEEIFKRYLEIGE